MGPGCIRRVHATTLALSVPINDAKQLLRLASLARFNMAFVCLPHAWPILAITRCQSERSGPGALVGMPATQAPSPRHAPEPGPVLVTNIPRSFSIGKAAGSGPAFCPRSALSCADPAPLSARFGRCEKGLRGGATACGRLGIPEGGSHSLIRVQPAADASQVLGAVLGWARHGPPVLSAVCQEGMPPPSLPPLAIPLSTSSTCSSGRPGASAPAFSARHPRRPAGRAGRR